MAKLEWGEKRACQSCGKNFYDMMRFPIVCPECGAGFTVVEAMPRRGTARGKGKYFPANREPAEEAIFESPPVAEDTAEDAEERDGDEEVGEPGRDGEDSDVVGEDEAA